MSWLPVNRQFVRCLESQVNCRDYSSCGCPEEIFWKQGVIEVFTNVMGVFLFDPRARPLCNTWRIITEQQVLKTLVDNLLGSSPGCSPVSIPCGVCSWYSPHKPWFVLGLDNELMWRCWGSKQLLIRCGNMYIFTCLHILTCLHSSRCVHMYSSYSHFNHSQL